MKPFFAFNEAPFLIEEPGADSFSVEANSQDGKVELRALISGSDSKNVKWDSKGKEKENVFRQTSTNEVREGSFSFGQTEALVSRLTIEWSPDDLNCSQLLDYDGFYSLAVSSEDGHGSINVTFRVVLNCE